MPKVRLTFSFDLPEEQLDYEQMSRVNAYTSALHDYFQWIREKYKYGGGTHGDPQRAYTECFDEFMRICREAGFDPLSGAP